MSQERTQSLHATEVPPSDWETRLLVIDGVRSRYFDLPAHGTIHIGRSGERTEAVFLAETGNRYHACLWIDNPAMSRDHAELVMSRGEARLIPFNSRNGTLVGSRKIHDSHLLLHGDIISIPRDTSGFVLAFLSRPRTGKNQQVCSLEEFRRALQDQINEYSQHSEYCILVVCVGLPSIDTYYDIADALKSKLLVNDRILIKDKVTFLIMRTFLSKKDLSTDIESLSSTITNLSQNCCIGIGSFPKDATDPDALIQCASLSMNARHLKKDSSYEDTVHRVELGDETVIVADPVMMNTFHLIRRLAKSSICVHLTGETGSGKDIAARAIHHYSQRRKNPFISVNCATLQDNLAESQLFGHIRGAFSGAVQTQRGEIEAAEGGSLFLDEVGELSLHVQAKLLRYLETKSIKQLGSTKERHVDVRVISATNRDLRESVRKGQFREDLYYRLSASVVEIPPLRLRQRELAPLANMFLAKFCQEIGRPILEISTEAMRLLSEFDWPGNIRELRNTMELAATLITHARVESDDLNDLLRRGGHGRICPLGIHELHTPAKSASSHFPSMAETLQETERNHMIRALRAVNGNKTRAAALIQMSLSAFKYKFTSYRIDESEFMTHHDE